MCGSKPKPPKPTREQIQAEKEAAELRKRELQAQIEDRRRLKADRLEAAIAMGGARYGRASLLTGSRGGQGYGAPAVRSLLGIAQ